MCILLMCGKKQSVGIYVEDWSPGEESLITFDMNLRTADKTEVMSAQPYSY